MFDPLSMIPGSVVEELIRDNAAEITGFLMDTLEKSVQWEPGEVPSLAIIIREWPKPKTIVVLVQALDAEYNVKRDVIQYDLRQILANVPIGAWLKAAKDLKKFSEQLEKLTAKQAAHVKKHGTDDPLLAKEIGELMTKMQQCATPFAPKPKPAALAQLPAHTS